MTTIDRRVAARVAIVVVAPLLAVVWNRAPEAGASPGGQQLYQRDCAICHGAQGDGGPAAPTLRNVGRADIDYYVTTGRMPLLPTARSESKGRAKTAAPGRFAVDNKLPVTRRASPYSATEQRALIDYTVALTGPGVSVTGIDIAHGNVAAGGELFRLNCAACHSWAAEGGALLHREAPTLGKATPRQTAEAVRVGPGAMPAFGTAALSDRQVADVVAYVHYLHHSHDPGGSALWHLGPVAEGAVAIVGGLGALLVFLRWIGERG